MRVHEPSDFRTNLSFLSSAININSRLPQNPFRLSSLYYRFHDFDWTMTEMIWNSIQILAQQSQDKSLLMAVIEPDPEKYFHFHFGNYAWGILPVSITSDQYSAYLNEAPPESPADMIQTVGDIIAWVPFSKQWAIWADRRCELCVIGSCLPFPEAVLPQTRGAEVMLDWCSEWADEIFMEQLEKNFQDSSP